MTTERHEIVLTPHADIDVPTVGSTLAIDLAGKEFLTTVLDVHGPGTDGKLHLHVTPLVGLDPL